MKFGKTFESYLTVEWRRQYMNYAELKTMIYQSTENVPGPEAPAFEVMQYYANFERIFFATCNEELNRVQNFYLQKLAEGRRKLDTLELKMRQAYEQHRHQTHRLGLTCCEFYMGLIMLQNFQILNYTGFRKICKKYDKRLESTRGIRWFMDNVSNAPFSQEQELKTMIGNVEDIYTMYLTNGNRAKAMAKLRVPPMGEPIPNKIIFVTGLILGLFIVSFGAVVISIAYFWYRKDVSYHLVRLYRGPTVLVLYSFLMALNVYIWQKSGINHVLIFNIDLRRHLQAVSFLEIASVLGYIWSMSMLLFVYYKEFNAPSPYYFPAMCILLPMALLANPIHIMNYTARMWILRVFGRILAAPLYTVRFLDFWMADQLLSLTMCAVDHYSLINFYINFINDGQPSLKFETDIGGIIVNALPYWFRFAQCLRRYHDTQYRYMGILTNAMKYFSGIIMVICSGIALETNAQYSNMFANPWIWAYIFASIISTIYFSAWDLFKDFGLLRVWSGENIFLRTDLIYPKGFYYFAIVSNILIRFIWVLEIILIYNRNCLGPFYCKTFCSIFEIFRRFIWNFVRMEHEHLYNCGHFRATREIYLKPLSKSDIEDKDD